MKFLTFSEITEICVMYVPNNTLILFTNYKVHGGGEAREDLCFLHKDKHELPWTFF